MSIIDSIQLSGNSYDVKDKSATTVVALTQAEYDVLPASAKTANILYNITDAEAVDFSQYWTSAETQSAITEATSGKVSTNDFNTYSGSVDTALNSKASQTDLNTLSGTVTTHTSNTTIHVTPEQVAAWNAKSDFSGSYNDLTNKLSAGTNITIVDNVISAEGGGGKVVTGGTNISVTTGETADTINCTLRAANTSGNGSMKLAFLNNTDATGVYSVATGYDCKAKGHYSFASGRGNNTNNYGECAVGFNNKTVGNAGSISKSSGCTLFSVGNGQGTSSSDLHNAFEVRQNGDIYITLNDQDVKLQDQLGGGGSSYSAGTGIDITNDVISVTGMTAESAFTAHTASTVHMTTTEKTNLDSLATNIAAISGITSTKVGNWDTASTNSHTHSNKTVLDGINSTKVSNWDGAATNASNAITALGGLSLVKLTQAQYDALSTKDSNTLYIING